MFTPDGCVLFRQFIAFLQHVLQDFDIAGQYLVIINKLKFHYSNNTTVKVKVNCTLVQALRLCTGCTAHRGSRGIALLFHDHGTRRG